MLRSLKRSLEIVCEGRMEMECLVDGVKEEFDIETYGYAIDGRDTWFQYELYTDEDITDELAAEVTEWLRKTVQERERARERMTAAIEDADAARYAREGLDGW